MASRYYQQNIAQYNPLSFEEMLYAPSMMRKQHDILDQSIAETDSALGQYNVLSQDQDFAQKAIDPVSKDLNSMAEQLAKQGYNPQSMSQFRKVRAQKDKLFSPTGDIGIAQSRLASFQQQAKELKEQYKDNPEIARYYINQLQQSPGLQRDIDNQLINQGLNSINNVRHYDATEINTMLNSQIDNIKDTLLKDYGFERVGNISSVQDIYREAKLQGRTADEVNQILLSQVSPEVIRSAQQYGVATMGSAQAGVQSLMNQVAGAAQGRANQTLTSDYSVVTNEDKKLEQTEAAARASLLVPGARLNTSNMQNLEFLGAEYKDGQFKVKDQNSMVSKVQDPFNLNNTVYYNSEGKPVDPKQAVERYVSTGTAGGLTPVLKEGYRKETSNEKARRAESKFLEIKKNSPVLNNLSNKEALEVMQNNFKNLEQSFSYIDAFKTNFDVVKNTIKANLPNSTFMDTDGNVLSLTDLSKQTGLTPQEISEQITPIGTGIRPTIGAVVEATLYDKQGKDIPLFIQSDALSSGASKTTTDVLNHIYSGQGTGQVKTQYINPQTGKSIIGVNTYILENYDGSPRVLTVPADLTSDQLNKLTGLSDDKILEMFDNPSNVNIQGVGELTQATANKNRNNIQSGKL